MDNKNKEILTDIYRSARMGIESINQLLSKVNDNKIYDELKYQLRTYEEVSNEAYNEILKMDTEPKDISTLTKVNAKMSIGMNTIMNNSPSHVADMMILGNTNGVTELTKCLNSNEKSLDEGVKEFTKRFIKMQQENIERLKKFL